MPPLGPVVAATVEDVRETGVEELEPFALHDLEDVQLLLRAYGASLLQSGVEPEAAERDTNLLRQLVWVFLCYELHWRKTFWVDEWLAWMLRSTRLDIRGSDFRLPFVAFAVLLDDPVTLDACDRLLRKRAGIESAPVRILGVHVCRMLAPRGTGVNFTFLFDRHDEHWPWLLSCDLVVRDDDRLDAVLDSHYPGFEATGKEPVLGSPELRDLVHLVINAILFATSTEEP